MRGVVLALRAYYYILQLPCTAMVVSEKYLPLLGAGLDSLLSPILPLLPKKYKIYYSL